MTTEPVSAALLARRYERSIARWARWMAFYDSLPRPIRQLVPRRYT